MLWYQIQTLLEKKQYFETCAKVFYNGFSYSFSHLAQKYQSEELNDPIVFVTKTRNGVSKIEMMDELLQESMKIVRQSLYQWVRTINQIKMIEADLDPIFVTKNNAILLLKKT
jgi:hypothetical protein